MTTTTTINPKKQYESLRNSYILKLVLLIIIIIIIYFINPFNILAYLYSVAGPTIFITLFLGLFCISMILYYEYLFKNPLSSGISASYTKNIMFVLFSFIISAGIIVLLVYALGLFSSTLDSNNYGKIVLNFLLLFVMLAIIYKILILSDIGKYPISKVILNSIFYIPCLFVNIIQYILLQFKQTNKDIYILLFFEIIFLVLYLLYPSFVSYLYLKDGNQIINKPVLLDQQNDVATFQTLNGSDKFNYQYCISCWIFIDAMPPSTDANYGKFTNLLNYGDTPSIQYNPSINTLLITVKTDIVPESAVDTAHSLEKQITTSSSAKSIVEIQTKIKKIIKKAKTIEDTIQLDEKGQRIIYTQKNMLLQKWNNIVLNYDGGTLDVFMNAELVKSVRGIVPYITYDTLTVGTENGISGGLSSLVYYKHTLDFVTINKLYNFMKDKNPPCL